jgi:cob(I)alamin adenosyltransferase
MVIHLLLQSHKIYRMPKIYTKRGDYGKSDLFYSTNIDKFSPLFDALGTLDELNSFIGLLSSGYAESPALLKELPHILFDLGAMIAMEKLDAEDEVFISELVVRCENEIDLMNMSLKPLRVFIVPGGSENVSRAHVCRSVARRAERCIWAFDKKYTPIGTFLNRLSDYFFVLSRYISHQEGGVERIWIKSEDR